MSNIFVICICYEEKCACSVCPHQICFDSRGPAVKLLQSEYRSLFKENMINVVRTQSEASTVVGLTFTHLAMRDRSHRVAIEAFLAVVTVATLRIVATVGTDSSAPVTRQLVDLQVEATLSRVQVTVARCRHRQHTRINFQPGKQLKSQSL